METQGLQGRRVQGLGNMGEGVKEVVEMVEMTGDEAPQGVELGVVDLQVVELKLRGAQLVAGRWVWVAWRGFQLVAGRWVQMAGRGFQLVAGRLVQVMKGEGVKKLVERQSIHHSLADSHWHMRKIHLRSYKCHFPTTGGVWARAKQIVPHNRHTKALHLQDMLTQTLGS